MIYLDSAATTAVVPEVLEKMLPYFSEQYGNPGALYRSGRDAAAAVSTARSSVAKMFHTTPEHILFTSGGSEGNSMVFRAQAEKLISSGKNHIVTTQLEHDSVLRSAHRFVTREKGQVTFLTPDETGFISAENVISHVTPQTGMVSVMYANNEIGTVNEIAKIGAFCRANGILFHCDCVQAAGQYDLNAEENGFDFATISAHKIHGPKGAGALYVRDLKTLEPLICGGSAQEHGLRGGTENVPGIVGIGAACGLAESLRMASTVQIASIKQVFVHSLLKHLGVNKLQEAGISYNGTPWFEQGKILNLTIDGVSGESAILTMDALGVCISAGSACTSHESSPSHVLRAIGLTDEQARHSIRLSFDRTTTEREAEQGGELLATCIMVFREYGMREV